MTEAKDAVYDEAVAMTRDDVLAQCWAAKGSHEISDACARAIVRHAFHGEDVPPEAQAFILRGELPPDDADNRSKAMIDGGTRLYRLVFTPWRRSANESVMADMLISYFVQKAEPRPGGRRHAAPQPSHRRPQVPGSPETRGRPGPAAG